MKKSLLIQLLFAVVFICTFGFVPSVQAGLSEFDISNNKIDLKKFRSGGPSKDGIPALSEPKFVPTKEADYLRPDDKVVGVIIDGEAKAYPIRILNWHEVVNDQISGEPIAVTWCPLTRSAVTFNREVQGETLEFGVSGLLYNSNVVFYDRNHDGLWSQLKEGGLTGKLASADLEKKPSFVTTWKKWKEEHPDTKVLSEDTGYWRDYRRDPYARYHASDETMFPVEKRDSRLPQKSVVVGVVIDGKAKAYPVEVVADQSGPIKDTFAGRNIRVYSSDKGIVMKDKAGNIVPSIMTYWFAWSSFHPNTDVYQ